MANDSSPEIAPEAPERSSAELARLETLAKSIRFLDRYSRVMDTYGGDVAAGLIPVLGDAATSIVSTGVQLYHARKAELPMSDQLHIFIRQLLDLGIGAIPIVGDIADYFYKSNVKAKDRFVAHFQQSLDHAQSAGIIAREDALRLQNLSRGVQ